MTNLRLGLGDKIPTFAIQKVGVNVTLYLPLQKPYPFNCIELTDNFELKTNPQGGSTTAQTIG